MRSSDWSSDVGSSDLGCDRADFNFCLIARACGFTGILSRALAAFMHVLDGYTLANLIGSKSEMAAIFGSGMANDIQWAARRLSARSVAVNRVVRQDVAWSALVHRRSGRGGTRSAEHTSESSQ